MVGQCMLNLHGVGSLSALVFYPSFARPPNVNSSRSDR
jgi:hypothetical protein